MKQYTAVIEQCKDTGLFVGYVPGIPGAHSQAESLDELKVNLQEVLELLQEEGALVVDSTYVGTQQVTIA